MAARSMMSVCTRPSVAWSVRAMQPKHEKGKPRWCQPRSVGHLGLVGTFPSQGASLSRRAGGNPSRTYLDDLGGLDVRHLVVDEVEVVVPLRLLVVELAPRLGNFGTQTNQKMHMRVKSSERKAQRRLSRHALRRKGRKRLSNQVLPQAVGAVDLPTESSSSW